MLSSNKETSTPNLFARCHLSLLVLDMFKLILQKKSFSTMQTIVTTIQHRPYVMAFLLVFFVLAILHLGIFRALIWLIWGYAVAFVSEYSSIQWISDRKST